MKSMRQRLNRNLRITTGSSDKSSKGDSDNSTERKIRSMTEAQFAATYRLEDEVMESTNRGMQVLFATRLSDGVQVVVKVRARAQSFASGKSERSWLDTTHVQLNMPRVETICCLLDVVVTKANYYVVMEKVEGMDLFELLSRERMSAVDSREVVLQILQALKAMHDQGRIHKDLKMENIMIDKTPKRTPRSLQLPSGSSPSLPGIPLSPVSPGIKLIDFDTVENWEPTSPKSKDVLGTDGYIAPEAYAGSYSPASDIFCVGVIMYKLLTRRLPYSLELFDDKPGENYVGSPAMSKIIKRLEGTSVDFTRAPFPDCPDACDLCRRMLAYTATERPSADEALQQKYFQLSPDELCIAPAKGGGNKVSKEEKSQKSDADAAQEPPPPHPPSPPGAVADDALPSLLDTRYASAVAAPAKGGGNKVSKEEKSQKSDADAAQEPPPPHPPSPPGAVADDALPSLLDTRYASAVVAQRAQLMALKKTHSNGEKNADGALDETQKDANNASARLKKNLPSANESFLQLRVGSSVGNSAGSSKSRREVTL